jgi:hypothetical protein
MEFRLKRLDKDDIPDLIKLSTSVGWDYDKEEIQTVMSSGQLFGHKDKNGDLVSSGAIIPYGNKLASMGMVIVEKSYRGLGLGKGIVKACVNFLNNETPIMLISTEEGKGLYQRLGFNTVSFVHKYLCNYYSNYSDKCDNKYEIIPYSNEYFHQVVKLDESSIGANRNILIRNRINQSKKCLLIKRREDVIGFGISIQTPENLILGPIIAPNDDAAIALINKLSEGHYGKFRIDVPDGKISFMNYLEKNGFIKVSQPPIMIANASQLPPRNGSLYGIAAQVFG